MKKFVGLIFVTLLMFSFLTPANIVNASNLSDSIVLQLTETHTDSQIDINVKLVTNTGISDMLLELDYNKNIFEFVSYDRGTALNNNFDLDVTPLTSERTLPIRLYWLNQNVYNDFSTGNLLKLHFNLRSDITSGDYEIGFNYNNSKINYINNGIHNLKSAIVSKAVVKISDSKITETEITQAQPINQKKNSVDIILILGSVLFAVSVVTTVTIIIVVRIKKKKRKREKWLEI